MWTKEVKLPTIWTDEKQSREEAERRERSEERRVEEKEWGKKMEMREKVGKSRNTVFFRWFVALEGRKVGSLKRRVRSQLARGEMKNCTPLWREAHFQVKMYKAPGARSTFGSWDVEKVHAVVARSTFWSQNVQNTPGPDHFWQLRCQKCTPLWREAHFQVKMYKAHQVRTTFGRDVEKVHAVVARSTFWSQNVQNTPGPEHFWKLRCRKSARRCGAKHILKSKCTKHTRCGPLLAVEMSKKCTPLWREAHFQVKMYKTHPSRTTFGGSDVASRGRSRGLCTLSKASKTWGFCSIFNYNHHYTTLHSNTLHSITLNYITLHYTTLHYITLQLHYLPLHYIPLHYTTLHYTTLHSNTLHYIALHYTTFHYTTLPSTTTTLPSTTLHYTTLHYITLHYTTLHNTTLHYITLHDTTCHYTTLHYTTLHFTEWHCTTDRQVDR